MNIFIWIKCTNKKCDRKGREECTLSISADINTTNDSTLVPFAYVLIDIGSPSRAKIADRAFEAWILLALVTQVSRQGTAMGKRAPAIVDTKELSAIRYLNAMLRQATVSRRNRRKPNVARIHACNRRSINWQRVVLSR